MTRLPESSSWEEEIELITRSERVAGGLDGPANRPLKSLANRTRYLKDQADKADESIAEKISAVKTFAEGATLESPRDEILFDGYRLVWTGAFPKTISTGSTPQSTGGIGAGRWAYTSDAVIRRDLASDKGTSGVGKLGDKPLVAISYYKSKGQSDQDAVQAAFDESSNIVFDVDVTLTADITFDRSEPCTVIFSPGVTVTNTNFLPRLTTHPNHKISGTTFRTKKRSAINIDGTSVKHQTLAVEMAVHDTLSSGPNYEPFVALMAAIESFNCERQKLWGMNILTNAHNLKAGDEVYGIEVDCNVDGELDGRGNYCGLYIAGAGDLSASAGADGIRVQRLRDGVSKWQYGQRIFDSVVGMAIYDASNYSILASGDAPIARQRYTQSGNWSYIHVVSSSVIPWGVDDYGDTYSRRLYLGTGNGKSKNRVNLDGGVKFYTTSAAVAWGAIAAGGYSEKDVTTLFGISVADWSNYTLDVTPVGYAGAMPVVAVQVYINSAKTQAYVRIINISGAALSECNVGLNAKLCGHSSTN
ncbi:hypothetical protein ACMZ6O_21440 [Klebsiella pneumoniae]|uniref:tail fiber/spike domain-containing protein n=1 Tax=Klebsiella pneumoniae TaxID=573 RepID=UPI002A9915EF|nr:hypothetical protein [Klebsiella pneumoniae]HEL7717250.1 hypothetical protein [Klebsiella pneumoniae]